MGVFLNKRFGSRNHSKKENFLQGLLVEKLRFQGGFVTELQTS
jgi:hypothetical protein